MVNYKNFDYTIYHLTRFTLNMYIDKQLNNFGNTNETKYIQKALQNTTYGVKDKFLDKILTEVIDENECHYEFDITKYIDEIFDKIIQTDEFKAYLKDAFFDNQPVDDYKDFDYYENFLKIYEEYKNDIH